MISENIKPLKTGIKRVLFVNPDNRIFPTTILHMGFSTMGGILELGGHEVKLIDYSFLRSVRGKIEIPAIEKVIYEFRPDVIGVSVFTSLYDECLRLIESISKCYKGPIILGGPHFYIFPQDFRKDNRISYIVRGEAEKVISNLIESAKVETTPIILDAPPPLSEEISEANLDIAYGNEYLGVYAIQLSRGCPYRCSFCIVNNFSRHKVRGRNLEVCLEQIIKAKKNYPNIKTVTITDDCPTFDTERFKKFLRMFREAETGCRLWVDNMRADQIDDEMIQLYKAAGGRDICIGVESGHPEVFNLINKHETLEDIICAAKLARRHNLQLGLCFVIGLPGDTLKRHLFSVRLAKKLKPDFVFWNMCVPWPGTEVNRWYGEHGKIGELRNVSIQISPGFNFNDPPCESDNFPKKDLVKAWMIANLETEAKDLFYMPEKKWRFILLIFKHKLFKSLVIWTCRNIKKRLIYTANYALSVTHAVKKRLKALLSHITVK